MIKTLGYTFALNELAPFCRASTQAKRYHRAMTLIFDLVDDTLAQQQPVPFLRSLTTEQRIEFAHELAHAAAPTPTPEATEPQGEVIIETPETADDSAVYASLEHELPIVTDDAPVQLPEVTQEQVQTVYSKMAGHRFHRCAYRVSQVHADGTTELVAFYEVDGLCWTGPAQAMWQTYHFAAAHPGAVWLEGETIDSETFVAEARDPSLRHSNWATQKPPQFAKGALVTYNDGGRNIPAEVVSEPIETPKGWQYDLSLLSGSWAMVTSGEGRMLPREKVY